MANGKEAEALRRRREELRKRLAERGRSRPPQFAPTVSRALENLTVDERRAALNRARPTGGRSTIPAKRSASDRALERSATKPIDSVNQQRRVQPRPKMVPLRDAPRRGLGLNLAGRPRPAAPRPAAPRPAPRRPAPPRPAPPRPPRPPRPRYGRGR